MKSCTNPVTQTSDEQEARLRLGFLAAEGRRSDKSPSCGAYRASRSTRFQSVSGSPLKLPLGPHRKDPVEIAGANRLERSLGGCGCRRPRRNVARMTRPERSHCRSGCGCGGSLGWEDVGGPSHPPELGRAATAGFIAGAHASVEWVQRLPLVVILRPVPLGILKGQRDVSSIIC